MIQIQEYLSGHSQKDRSLKRSIDCDNCTHNNCKKCKKLFNVKIVKDLIVLYDTIMTDVSLIIEYNIFNINYTIINYPDVFYLNLTSYLFNHNIYCLFTSKNSFCISTKLELKDILPIINNLSVKLNMIIESVDEIQEG